MASDTYLNILQRERADRNNSDSDNARFDQEIANNGGSPYQAPPLPVPPSGMGGFDPSTITKQPTNIFDQFDAPAPQQAKGNVFDQFDAPKTQTKGNVFDQFDQPEPPEKGFFEKTGDTLKAIGRTHVENELKGNPFYMRDLIGGVDALGSGGAQMAAMAAAGLYGTAKSYADGTSAADEIKKAQGAISDTFPIEPETDSGKALLGLGSIPSDAIHGLANAGFEATGQKYPALAAIAEGAGNALLFKGALGRSAADRPIGNSVADNLKAMDTPPPDGGAPPAGVVPPDAPVPSPIHPDGQMELPLSNDISQSPIAEAARNANPQADMFEPPRTDLPPDQPVRPVDPMHQSEIDDTDRGYMANQYGGGQDGMRIDENGIPIRADRSMEAQNLQDPLQRNLWGDELKRQSEQEAPRGITAAIDKMPPGEDRQAALDQLRFPKGQRGGIDTTAIGDGFQSIRDKFDKLGLTTKVTPMVLGASGDSHSIMVEMHNRRGERVGLTDFSQRPDGTLTAENVKVAPSARGQGAAKRMYLAARDAGYDIAPGKVQTDLGAGLVDSLQRSGIINKKAEGQRFSAGNLDLQPLAGETLPGERAMRVPASQRGAIDLGPQRDHESEGRRISSNTAVDDRMRDAGRPFDWRTPAEKLVTNLLNQSKDTTDFKTMLNKPFVPKDYLGKDSYIPPIEPFESAKAKILSEGKDGPSLWQNTQSGLSLSAEKAKSYAMLWAARTLAYGEKMGDRLYRQNASPVERAFTNLSKKELSAQAGAMREEMFNGKTYSDAQLQAAGMSPKAIEAHKAMRAALQDVLTATNASLVKLDKPPITAREGYMASMWNGNWHLPIFGKDGKLAWYLKTESMGELNAAVKYMQNDPKLASTLALDKIKIDRDNYKPVNVGSRAPMDVLGAYQDMIKHFSGDREVVSQMREAMESYTEDKAFTFQNHNQHFENKMNVRGFQGDRPWLSEHENAMAQTKAQFNYMRSAYHWAPMQESLAHLKNLLADPEVNEQQPNNMKLIKNYAAQNMGISKNMFRAIENSLQKMLGSIPGTGKASFVPTSIAKFVHSLKTMTYLTQLGLSAGYMVATPLQSFLLAPAWHMKLTGSGMRHSALKTAATAMYDFAIGLTGHGTGYDMPMTALGKEAFKYMEDNGIISTNIFHENSGLGDYPAIGKLKQGLGWTISAPEKVARSSTFMSFAHHLNDSGRYDGNLPALFQRAEELTNHVLTNFSRGARPLVIDKIGQMGEMAYTYKSAIFNQWNNLGLFARDAIKGSPKYLMAALLATGVMGGINDLPGVNELDDAFSIAKEGLAEWYPAAYGAANGNTLFNQGIRGTVIQYGNEFAANDKVNAALGTRVPKFLANVAQYGLASAATGTQLASRFSSSVGDLKNPTDQFAPAVQEAKEWAGGIKAGMHPTDKTGWEQGVYSALAPQAGKGAMEGLLPDFKTVKQTDPKTGEVRQGYASTSDIAAKQTTITRSPHDEALRYLGVRSLDEATTKNDRYINNQESSRLKTAQDSSIKSMFKNAVNGNMDDAKEYARAYFMNGGDQAGFETELNKKINEYAFTPEQAAIMRAQSVGAYQNIQRFRKMHYGH